MEAAGRGASGHRRAALGYYDAARRLSYAGSVGAGFTDQELKGWRAPLEALA
jgi:ATP-dependent DNA ligase